MQKYSKYVVALVFLTVLGAALFAGLWMYRNAQTRRWRQLADEAVSQRQWREATRYYGFYLSRVPEDIPALEQYATANLQIISGRMGALQNAATAYHQILRYEPENRDAEDKLLDLYRRMRNWPTLEYYAREFLNHRADDPYLLRVLGDALKAMGRHAEAVDIYQKILARGDAEPTVYRNVIELLRIQDQPAAARALLDQACEAQPQHAALRALRAEYLFSAGEREAAALEITAAAQIAPDDYYVLYVQAQMAARNRDWSAASEWLNRALQKYPEDPDLLLFAVQTHVRLGHPERAVALLAACSPILFADHPELWITYGDVQITAGKTEDAEKTVSAFLDSHPEQKPIADFLRGRLLLARAQPEAAAEFFATTVRQRPNFLPAQFYLALAYLASGKEGLGRSALEAYITRNPEDERARLIMSWRQPAGGSIDEIAKQARDLLDKGPDVPDVYLQTATFLFRVASAQGVVADYVDTVVALFERTLGIRPDSEDAFQGLIETLAIAQRYAQAKEAIAEAERRGIEKDILQRWRAYVALAERKPKEADQFFLSFLEHKQYSAQQLTVWDDIYARWGYPERMVELLTSVLASAGPEHQVDLQLARVTAALRAGRLSDAFQWLDELALPAEKTSSLVNQINETRAATALLALVQEVSRFLPLCEKVVADIRKLDATDKRATVVEAHIMLTRPLPDIPRARQLFRDILAENPDDFGAQAGLVRCCLKTDDLAGALFYLRRIVQVLPDLVTPLRIQLANRFLDFGQAQESLALARASKDLRGANIEASLIFARAAAIVGDTSAATDVLAELQSNPELPAHIQQRMEWSRVLVLAAAGKKQEAEELSQRCVSFEDGAEDLPGEVRDALLFLGKADEAEDLLERRVQARQSQILDRMQLATFQIRRGGQDPLNRSIATLSRILFEDSTYIPAMRLLAEALLRRGDVGQALAVVDRILVQDAQDAAAWYAKARCLRQIPGKRVAARDAIDRAVNVASLPEYLYFRGVLLMEDKNYVEARQSLEQAASSMGRTPAELDLRLARILAAAGEKERAQALLESAVAKSAETGESLDARIRAETEQALLGSNATPSPRREP